MNTEIMIRELKRVEEAHKNDKVFTGNLDIAAMAHDVRKRLQFFKPYEDTGLTPDEINALRERDKNDGWIPVEKRLPEPYQQVLVSMYNDLSYVTTGHYSDYRKEWDVEEWITDLGIDVKAWRPLPEPYRPGRRKNE